MKYEVIIELNDDFIFREVVQQELFPDGSPVNIPLSFEIPNAQSPGNLILFALKLVREIPI